jgi:hypothetical protein
MLGGDRTVGLPSFLNDPGFRIVGMAGFEPAKTTSQTWRADRYPTLRQEDTNAAFLSSRITGIPANGAPSRNRTRVYCLQNSSSTIELQGRKKIVSGAPYW